MAGGLAVAGCPARRTRGYRNHPQLDRFKNHAAPHAAISLYLKGIHLEALARGYSFDKSKIKPNMKAVSLTVTIGQIESEWKHLMAKLNLRGPALYRKWQFIEVPEAHPMFGMRPGEIES